MHRRQPPSGMDRGTLPVPVPLERKNQQDAQRRGIAQKERCCGIGPGLAKTRPHDEIRPRGTGREGRDGALARRRVVS